ncbi:MAG: HAMP domain-containing histidine kinase [Synechococcaceae cyanobacterium RM1_1_27]|nr:HAMP domain-containing histidine kinase [Synechococcaceae cyanobacterium RM1_1_27]
MSLREYPWVYDNIRQGQSCYFSTQLEDMWVSLFIAPVQDDLCTLGDILVMRSGHESFRSSEIRLVEQVANQCSIGLRQSRLFAAVQNQVQELHRLNHLKDDFLSTVSHELRSPMANIKMATRMLGVNLERINVPPNVQRYMQILQEEGDREINLINDLLDLARLEADTPQLSLKTMDLSELIQKLILPLESRLKTQQQRFDLEIGPDAQFITTDVSYLERILGELLHNACKYTPSGERILVDIQVSIQASSMLQIQVINTGVEIPPQECDRIFDKFYRVPNNDPWKHGGTGLGLALVKRMVKVLRGAIEMSSRNNSTCFAINLPRHL